MARDTVTASGETPIRERVVAWAKDRPFGAEYARLELGRACLRAVGVAIGSDPLAYRLSYDLLAADGFITKRLAVHTEGEGWSRTLELHRGRTGAWDVETTSHGKTRLGAPGGAVNALAGALDADLGLSPAFNTMPVLRHRVLEGDATPELVMAWISVPDLAILPSRQRYTPGRRTRRGQLVRFETIGQDDPFDADIVFDSDGVVLDYPGIARRLR